MVTFTTSVDPNEMLLLCGISSVSTLFVKEKKILKGTATLIITIVYMKDIK